jgi:hypothetical protein
MARISLDVDVEYAMIKMFGVWFTLAEIHALQADLNNIMEPRDWQPTTKGEKNK